MQFEVRARYIRMSPYKMRPLVDVIRGKSAQFALDWLTTYSIKRALPIEKMIRSAAANAKHLNNIDPVDLYVKEVCVDEGPMFRYFKPGAMGRSNIYRKRSCHMKVTLAHVNRGDN
jgi:large subunit ribosomal protein L22